MGTNRRSHSLIVVVSILMAVFVCQALAVTVDSSSGWESGYGPANTVDGIWNNTNYSNMGWAQTNGWVIYDFGTATTVNKVRITSPEYGGSVGQTYNPTSGTFEFSSDKVTWTAPVAWSAPQISGGAGYGDAAESALDKAYTYRYVRWTITSGGRIGEIFFIGSPQLAVWEMSQDPYYSTNYPAWQTADNNPATFGVIVGDTSGVGLPYITYDMGVSRMVYGFTMQARPTWADGNTPTGGELWASNNPSTGYAKVSNWTTPTWTNGELKTIDLGVGNAKPGRYVQLRNLTSGSQWAELTMLSYPATESVGIGSAKTRSDGALVQCTGVVIAAFTGRFYIETQDRSGGIRVDMATYGVSRNQLATITGTMTTDVNTGERYLTGQQATGTAGTAVLPVAVSNKTLGGF